jgi:hypothetical protein
MFHWLELIAELAPEPAGRVVQRALSVDRPTTRPASGRSEWRVTSVRTSTLRRSATSRSGGDPALCSRRTPNG